MKDAIYLLLTNGHEILGIILTICYYGFWFLLLLGVAAVLNFICEEVKYFFKKY